MKIKTFNTEIQAQRGKIEITVLVFLSAAASLYMYKYMCNHVHNDSVGAAIRPSECSECGLDSTWNRCFRASILDSKNPFFPECCGLRWEGGAVLSEQNLRKLTHFTSVQRHLDQQQKMQKTGVILSCSVTWKDEQCETVGGNVHMNSAAAPLPPRLHVAI